MVTNAKRVAYTKWSKGGQGEYPVRYVVLEWPKKGEYSRNIQIKDGKNDDYYIYGHYYLTFDAALNDLKKSVQENNRDYPVGNVSHIPDGLNGLKILAAYKK